MKYFISGIGTDVGKTVVSAILTEALQADYWKPVQAGDLHFSDTDKVRSLVKNPYSKFHQEAYRLQTPASPHLAALIDGIDIALNDFLIPNTDNNLLIEGAGGLMVPLNARDMVIDLIKKLAVPVILVSRNYLGSINHTMLSVEALRSRQIPIAGIIFNGQENPSTENWLLSATSLPCIARIKESKGIVDANFVSSEAIRISEYVREILIK